MLDKISLRNARLEAVIGLRDAETIKPSSLLQKQVTTTYQYWKDRAEVETDTQLVDLAEYQYRVALFLFDYQSLSKERLREMITCIEAQIDQEMIIPAEK